MKYKNANGILPEGLIDMIQDYVQGEYIYIPIREKTNVNESTDYKVELQKRDSHIYTKHLEGLNNKRIAQLYNLAESSIRRIIINQRKKYDMMREKVDKIITKWEVKSDVITQIYNTVWQVGEDYMLKVYEDKSMLERNIKIMSILAGMKVPVGEIIDTKDNKTFASDGNYYYILCSRLSGNNIVTINDDINTVSQMGQIIADLHLAFLKCEEQESFWDNSLLEEMNGWVKQSLENNEWKYIEKESYEMIVSNLESLYKNLPVQLIHRDVHFGNFLFDKREFSGYIDFDLSQRNIRIFDLCYFLLGLLSEKEKFEITENQWFEILKNVFEGYEKKIKLSEEEKKVVPYVMECIELLFAAYFLNQKDTRLADSAIQIFNFVKAQEEQIWHCIN
ncbi:CD3324 family protein [Anaerosporobacter sp.]|uniref:CD3324 family protein n=1 Tax=Anaerosporobacter sp. TaxID=1872529 RepID=UPI00286F571C|nr:CD3324 family protein [Anaerosporobacter sp.]